ncbi:unnamed protein product, partial [Lampetra planeri]
WAEGSGVLSPGPRFHPGTAQRRLEAEQKPDCGRLVEVACSVAPHHSGVPAMASNSIFDSFSNYSSSLLRVCQRRRDLVTKNKHGGQQQRGREGDF